jgi:NADH-quinone oxidoreductase E subunit
MAEQPQFSEQVQREIEAIFDRYPNRRAALLPLLHLLQRELGHISEQAELYAARLTGLPPVKVHEVASFYTMLHLKPVGRYHLQFCRTLSCALRGGEKLQREACKRLKIGDGQVSEDGRFSVEGVECLGVCGNAPAMQINEDFQLDLDQAKLERLLEELERGE